ncbi:MAG TPA: hypothetical protein PLR62_03110, partial [Candidatus Woesebacteria bacterium]|nr:hypothetical protein [Candidatus Woesebacteria bacterium]
AYSRTKNFLTELEKLIQSQNWQAPDLQQAIFDLAKASLGTKQGFAAIYLAFLGKKAGPKAAWFLLNIDPQLRQERIEAINQLK